jgi:high-affinity iron transporter
MLWCLTVLATTAWATPDDGAWHRAVGLLEYLEGDYPAAVAGAEADELAEQRGLADELVKSLEQQGDAGKPYLDRARAIARAIETTAPGPDVAGLCRALAQVVVTERHLARSPKTVPDLKRGAAVFAEVCSSCHGPLGKGDGAASTGMTPAPANFHDAARMATQTPYKAFNTVTFGITGTAMGSFAGLPADERWAVAFYLFTLRHPACTGQAAGATLEQLATSTDDQLAQMYGAGAVPCVRAKLPEAPQGGLADARARVAAARALFVAGDRNGARQGIVDAYLLGFEPLEPRLKTSSPALVERLEKAFTEARLAAQSGSDFEAKATALEAALTEEPKSGAGDFWAVFAAALLILLREGFEAVVVVGALLAVLKKMGAAQHVNVVHAGWASSLVAGAIVFVAAEKAFAGANREWLETVVALFAVGMLLYAALWLNARASMSAFMTQTRAELTQALGRGSLAGVFAIAFTSVGRESIETVLFLQGLAGDSRAGVIWGAATGLLALLVLVVFVRTVGFRLPMQALFKASTILLLATAVMLLGKGIHGLQELGVVRLTPVPFITVSWLGLFPDALCLGAQLVLAIASALVLRSQQPVKRTPSTVLKTPTSLT